MSLSMKIRTRSSRKATTVTIAPSWFWKKNFALSDSRAGSRRLAAFHIRLPAIANTAIPTRIPISSGRFPWSNLCFRSETTPTISPQIAMTHATAAKIRSRVAVDFCSCVARHSLVTSTGSGLSSAMFRSPCQHTRNPREDHGPPSKPPQWLIPLLRDHKKSPGSARLPGLQLPKSMRLRRAPLRRRRSASRQAGRYRCGHAAAAPAIRRC